MSRMKCRIWDKQNNRYWEDVNEGYLGRIEQLSIGPSGDLRMRTIDKMIHESMFPDRFIVEYHVGLCDCKGINAYEGDIIKSEIYTTIGDCYVIDDMTEFHYLTRDLCLHMDDFEIIGNIHTTPELLEVE